MYQRWTVRLHLELTLTPRLPHFQLPSRYRKQTGETHHEEFHNGRLARPQDDVVPVLRREIDNIACGSDGCKGERKYDGEAPHVVGCSRGR
jgi:hypothetical protein